MRDAARALGFAAVGITDATALDDGPRWRDWLARGFHAGMRWMERPGGREDPRVLLPGARSIVVVGWNVFRPAAVPAAGEGTLARFAALPDYHDLIRGKLEALLGRLRGIVPCRGRACVDAEPLLERALARRAGLGWAGKSACLVSQTSGPWLLLGELLLDVDLEPDCPVPSRCGTCGRCRAACPTGAIVAPGVVDANRCVAYLTIEHRGAIPDGLREGIGARLFGCDACQEACPWSRVVPTHLVGTTRGVSPEAETPGGLPGAMPAAAFLAHTDETFRAAFAGTALLRAGRSRMARNAAVVLGNLGDRTAVPALDAALGDPDPVVREHAAWALERLAPA